MRKLNFPGEFGINNEVEEPSKVKAVTRLKSDLTALSVLLVGGKTYHVPVRVNNNDCVGYGMGDASGDGFVASFYIDGVLLFRYG